MGGGTCTGLGLSPAPLWLQFISPIVTWQIACDTDSCGSTTLPTGKRESHLDCHGELISNFVTCRLITKIMHPIKKNCCTWLSIYKTVICAQVKFATDNYSNVYVLFTYMHTSSVWQPIVSMAMPLYHLNSHCLYSMHGSMTTYPVYSSYLKKAHWTRLS